MKHANLLLSLGGIALLAALCACGTSHPQDNSNTNWLRECSAAADCSGDELCACGVCTVSCNSDDTCQNERAPDAVCASVAELQCSGAGKGAVCTASCERNADCGDGALSCWQGSCVDLGSTKNKPDRDAAVGPEGDAQVEDKDNGPMEAKDSGVTRPTKPPTQSMTCEERLGCDADSACRDDRCQRLWSGDGCEPAAQMRPSCTTDADCDQGLLCHVDGTCIEPGKCDRFGTSTVASLPFATASALVLAKDDAYVLDYGTVDQLNNHNGDGAVVRVSLADGSAAGLITGIEQPIGMLIDPTHIHAISGGPVATIVSADRSDLSNRVELTASQPLSLAHDAGHLYFATKQSDGTFELSRVTSGTSTLEKLTDEHWDNVYFVAVDGQYAYVTADGAMQRVPLAGGPLATPFPYPLDTYAVDRDHLFYSEPPPNQGMITALSKDGTEVTTLSDAETGAPNFLRAYRGHVYFLRYLQSSESAELSRVAIVPGSEDVFATLTPPALGVNAFDVSDQGLFWVQDHHLVRQVIEDFGQSGMPAQGSSGGPCYGDLACDEGLSCIDALCTVVEQTCEERLGCDANSACLNAHCQSLWSGNGCERAAETRPACVDDASCDPGFVCHIDGTCIAPGKCDRFGLTTLASIDDSSGLILTKDAAFVLEPGTEDSLGNHKSDGAIVRVGFDGSVDPVVTGLYRPLDMKMDPARVYWRSGVSGEIALSSADRAGGANRIEIPFGGANLSWVQSATHIYVATDAQPPGFDLYRVAKGTSTLEKLSDDSWSGDVSAMGIDSQYVYLSSASDGRWSIADKTFSQGISLSPEFIDRDRFYYVEQQLGPRQFRIGAFDKSANENIVMANIPFTGDSSVAMLQPYRDHVYFALDDGGVSTLWRAPIVPGDAEQLVALGSGTFMVAISDRGAFWIQDHRLLNMVLEDYAAGPSPAQGAAGGPCYGDLACDGVLTCVDWLCQ